MGRWGIHSFAGCEIPSAGFCREAAGSQGSAEVPEAHDEALWPAGFDRHGQASVIPGGVAGDRQRGSPRDQTTARQPGRKLAPADPRTRTDDGQIQGRRDRVKIRRRPRLDRQPLQPPAPSRPPRHFQARPNRRPGRVASTSSLKALDCRFYKSCPVSPTMPVHEVPDLFGDVERCALTSDPATVHDDIVATKGVDPVIDVGEIADTAGRHDSPRRWCVCGWEWSCIS